PCRLAVVVKTAAGLPARLPDSHRLLVPSMKYLSGAAMLPKRVGLPRISAEQCFRSSSVQYRAPDSGISGALARVSGDTLGTVRTRASIPACSTPSAIRRAMRAVAPLWL